MYKYVNDSARQLPVTPRICTTLSCIWYFALITSVRRIVHIWLEHIITYITAISLQYLKALV